MVDASCSSADRPHVVWTGSEFVLAWHMSNTSQTDDIEFARIGREGAVVGGTVKVVSSYSAFSQEPKLAWTGSEFGLIYRDNGQGKFAAAFLRVTSEGQPIGSPNTLSDGTSEARMPALAWNENGFGVVWAAPKTSLQETSFIRVMSDGAVTGTELVVSADDSLISNVPKIVWTGSEYGVVWNDMKEPPQPRGDVWFQRIGADGQKLGGAVKLTEPTGAPRMGPELAWTGSEYGVTWLYREQLRSEVYFARVSTSGQKIGVPARITYHDSVKAQAALIWDYNEFAIAWEDERAGSYANIHFQRFDSEGQPIGSAQQVSYSDTTSTGARSVSLAREPGMFGIAWSDERSGDCQRHIYFARIPVPPPVP